MHILIFGMTCSAQARVHGLCSFCARTLLAPCLRPGTDLFAADSHRSGQAAPDGGGIPSCKWSYASSSDAVKPRSSEKSWPLRSGARGLARGTRQAGPDRPTALAQLHTCACLQAVSAPETFAYISQGAPLVTRPVLVEQALGMVRVSLSEADVRRECLQVEGGVVWLVSFHFHPAGFAWCRCRIWPGSVPTSSFKHSALPCKPQPSSAFGKVVRCPCTCSYLQRSTASKYPAEGTSLA